MKVIDLIKQLQQLNQNAEVLLSSDPEGNSYSRYNGYCPGLAVSAALEEYQDIEWFQDSEISDLPFEGFSDEEIESLVPVLVLFP